MTLEKLEFVNKGQNYKIDITNNKSTDSRKTFPKA